MVEIALLRECGSITRSSVKGLPNLSVSFKIKSQVGLDVLLREQPEIPMSPAMATNLKKRIGQELLRAFLVIEKPFAAWKNRCLRAKPPQRINDFSVVARYFAGILAEIESERDELFAVRKFNAAN